MKDRQPNDTKFYEKTTSNHIGEVINRINLHIHNMLQRGEISQNTCNYLTTDNGRTQQFYLLPKIHKDASNPPGRPIVSGSGGPTEKNIPTGGPLHWQNCTTIQVIC